MRFKNVDLKAAFESAFEAASESAFGDAWSREAVRIESAFGSAFEAADDITDLLLGFPANADVHAAEARVDASVESLIRTVEGLVADWAAHKAAVLEYVLEYLLEAELRTVRKYAIEAADEASKQHWVACKTALEAALESGNRSVVLDYIFAQAVLATDPPVADGLADEWVLYTNVTLGGAIGAIGQSAPKTTYAELKAIREICTVAYRAAALEVAYRAKRNACMAAPEANVREAVNEAVGVLKHEFTSSSDGTDSIS